MHKKSISFISFTRYLQTFHNDRADPKCTAINSSKRPQKDLKMTSKRSQQDLKKTSNYLKKTSKRPLKDLKKNPKDLTKT